MTGSDQEHMRVADAERGHWADRWTPVWMRPYLRLARMERPIGWWLLLWPCWWSLALVMVARGEALPNLWYMLLFWVGAVVMRGAGCTYNDLVDQDIDGKVERTRSRPIPSGQVTPRAAKIFLLLQALVGLIVLLQFNTFSIALGVASLGVVAIYPFMKRITHWPQLVLGFAFNWGALMGWAVSFGSLDWPPVLLYFGGIAWTIGYDTIYAHQDKEDDAMIGVKSTALLFGEKTKWRLTQFYGLASVLFLISGLLAGAGIVFVLGMGAAALHLVWQVATLDTDDGDNCLARFRANRTFGWVLFAALALDAAILSLI